MPISITKGTSTAQAVLHEKLQGRSLPTNLGAIIADEYLEVEPLSSVTRFEGRLEVIHGKPTIFINTHAKSLEEPRVRFTLAHEIGHYFMHRRLLRRVAAIHDESFRFAAESRQLEQEANDFASECLLPTSVVLERLRGKVLTLSLLEGIGSAAKASLQASAIKVASLASSRCCFYWEEQGAIKWAAPSDDWRERWFRSTSWRGEAIPSASRAATTSEGFSETSVARVVWCPGTRAQDEPLYESAVMTGYGRLIFVVDANADGLIER